MKARMTGQELKDSDLDYMEYCKNSLPAGYIAKKDDVGSFTCESVWQDWKGWDFGQKTKPSKYLTFLVYRILKRMDMVLSKSSLK